MTEAEALDLALPALDRAGLVGPDALAVLRALRMSLSEVLFVRCEIGADGVSRYWIGAPEAPTVYVPKVPGNALMLHTLIDTGMVKAEEWDSTVQPVDSVRNKLERVIQEIRPLSETLYRAIYPLDRAVGGSFRFARQDGAPLIITKHT